MSFQALNWVKSMRLGDSSARFVAYMLANYADEAGSCYPTIASLAADTDLSERTVRSAIKRLTELGLVAVVRQRNEDGTLGRNRYRLALDAKPKTADQSGAPAAKIAAGEGGKSPAATDAPPAATDAPPAATVAGPIKDKPPLEPSSEPPIERERAGARGHGPSDEGVPSGDPQNPDVDSSPHQPPADDAGPPFTAFWRKWPNRLASSRPNAEKAWAALSATDREAAIAGIMPFHEGLKGQGRKMVPAAATYLADRKWDDLDTERPPDAPYLPPMIPPCSALWTAALIEMLRTGLGRQKRWTLRKLLDREAVHLVFGEKRDGELVEAAGGFIRARVDSAAGQAFLGWLEHRLAPLGEAHRVWRFPDDFWLYLPPEDLAKAWGVPLTTPPLPADASIDHAFR